MMQDESRQHRAEFVLDNFGDAGAESCQWPKTTTKPRTKWRGTSAATRGSEVPLGGHLPRRTPGPPATPAGVRTSLAGFRRNPGPDVGMTCLKSVERRPHVPDLTKLSPTWPNLANFGQIGPTSVRFGSILVVSGQIRSMLINVCPIQANSGPHPVAFVQIRPIARKFGRIRATPTQIRPTLGRIRENWSEASEIPSMSHQMCKTSSRVMSRSPQFWRSLGQVRRIRPNVLVEIQTTSAKIGPTLVKPA